MEEAALFEAIANVDLKSLNKYEKKRLAEALVAYENQQKYNYINSLYPDDGPLSRDKYHKHLEFFRAGAKYKERCIIAANRCITPWTHIETAGSTRPALEVLSETSAHVLSWGGEYEYDDVIYNGFLKGIEPAYRVLMDNGQFFDCSRKHQVLSSLGWISLDQLVLLSSGLRCWHKAEDYQANCVEDGYLCDPKLLLDQDIAQALPPLKGDVQRYSRLAFLLSDAMERISIYSHAYQLSSLRSNLDACSLPLGLFSLFLSPAVDTSVLRTNEKHHIFSQFADELAPHLLSFSLGQMGQRSYTPPCQADVLCRGDLNKRLSHLETIRDGQQFLDATILGSGVEELHHDASRIGIFYPSCHPELIGGGKIVSVIPIGYQPIIDGTVEKNHNYKAAGVFHHNSGKTLGGCYETTCHLTGDYPEWWEGHKFYHGVDVWVAGTTNETTRDILQSTLCGPPGHLGEGTIPKDRFVGKPRTRMGIPGAYDTAMIKHSSGEQSMLQFKSYNQGRISFEGTAKHVIHLDEEPPADIYNECLLRTMTTQGIIYLTFTPLQGISDTVLSFLPNMKPGESR